jgi:hypothetical protein
MDINQIVGPAKDPVAHVEEDRQLKATEATHAVQPAKREEESRQPQRQEPPSFAHLRQDPLQLLLRAISARLGEVFTFTHPPRVLAIDSEERLTPEATTARVLRLIAAARDHYDAQPADSGLRMSPDALRAIAASAVRRGYDETRDVLGNLGMLDAVVAAALDRTLELLQAALDSMF